MNNDFLKRIGMVSFIFLFCFLLTIFNLISIQFQFYFASYYLVLFAFVSALILVLLNSISFELKFCLLIKLAIKWYNFRL